MWFFKKKKKREQKEPWKWTQMDPNRIIQALKGTIDPNMRIVAENELNQVGESWYSTSKLNTNLSFKLQKSVFIAIGHFVEARMA